MKKDIENFLLGKFGVMYQAHLARYLPGKLPFDKVTLMHDHFYVFFGGEGYKPKYPNTWHLYPTGSEMYTLNILTKVLKEVRADAERAPQIMASSGNRCWEIWEELDHGRDWPRHALRRTLYQAVLEGLL